MAVTVVPVSAEPSLRAFSVVEGLGVSEPTATRLLEIVSRHDQEILRLARRKAELQRRLVTAQNDAPQVVENLLDESIATQRAIVQAEERLLARVRQVVSPKLAARLLVLLAATEPTRAEEQVLATPPPLPPSYAQGHRQRSLHDPNALFPPGSSARTPCDPFASMHGCRY